MIDVSALIRALSDNGPHACEQLSRHFGANRMSISRGLEYLESMGIEVEYVRGQGYRLTRRIDLLDAQTILQSVNTPTRASIANIEVLSQVDSTNTHLMRRGASGAPSGQVCLAERQTAGKGCRGRHWISPFAANVYMSVLWRFNQRAVNPGRVTTGIGVAIADALTSLNATDITLKWPNDFLWRRRKLGGILVEMAGEASGPGYIVIGVGLNVRMPETHAQKIDQPCTDLFTVMNGAAPSRPVVAARLLEAIIAELEMLEHGGRRNLEQAWRRYDCNLGLLIELRTAQGREHGIAMGIDADGRLIMASAGRQRAFTCGEVSLRSGA